MASFDRNACDANAMAVKLRHAETNSKLARTPYNLESAIEALFEELLDLYGEDGAYHVFGTLASKFAAYKDWPAEHPEDSAVKAGTEALVNAFKRPGSINAHIIVSELRDMDLLDGE